jgi:hypothetical protein
MLAKSGFQYPCLSALNSHQFRLAICAKWLGDFVLRRLTSVGAHLVHNVYTEEVAHVSQASGPRFLQSTSRLVASL